MNIIRAILMTIKMQMETFTLIHPLFVAAAAGYFAFRITKKVIHLILTVIGIFVLYEILVTVTGWGVI